MEIHRAGGAIRATPGHAGERLRIVLLRSDDPHHRWLEAQLARQLHVVGVVVEPGRAELALAWRRRRFVAWAAHGYQVWRQRLTGRAGYRRRYFERLATEVPADLPHVEVDWINADAARAAVAELAPDVVVVCGTGFVRSDIYGPARLAINVHGGYLPDYKGNHCVYFAYERGDFEHIGASLHLLTPELDSGEVLDVVRPEIFPHDNDEHLYCRSIHLAGLRLCNLLEALEAREPLPYASQPAAGETFRHRDRTPGRELRLWLRRRLGRHPVPHLEPAGSAPVHTRPASLDHVVVAVSDWERSNVFYRDVLGAELVELDKGRFAYRFGAQQLNVHGPGSEPFPVARERVRPGNSDLCFVWSGAIEGAVAHLRSHGVEVEEGPVPRRGGRGEGTSVYFRDPDGSLLELIAYG